MIWNGFISAAEIGYVNYCILLVGNLKEKPGDCLSDKAMNIFNKVVYTTQVILI